MRPNTLKGSRGFTLIELLVVIAIIAILAAILFPVFAKVREKARQTACASNEKQLALAVIQYQQDYDELFPIVTSQNTTTGPAEIFNYAPGNLSVPGEWGWIECIYPFVKSKAVFTCPDDRYPGMSPDDSVPSYGMNKVLGWTKANGWRLPQFDGTNRCTSPSNNELCWDSPYHISKVNAPTDTILLVDLGIILESGNAGPRVGGKFDGYPGTTALGGYSSCPGGPLGGSQDIGCIAIDYPQVGGNRGVQGQHSGGANAAFVDGHVKYINPGKYTEYAGLTAAYIALHYYPEQQ